MSGFTGIAKKALYLGIGLATYAGEQATAKLLELQTRLQQLADEMVSRGEMTTEEARQWMNDLMEQSATPSPNVDHLPQPRQIEITEDASANEDIIDLRQQISQVEAELRHLKLDD